MTPNPLPRSFYNDSDVVSVAKKLLGKRLITQFDGHITSGFITETEAYCGRDDKGCHANNGLRTERTKVMYGPPGIAYVYLCYGIHHLFNIVTNHEELADAVLVRSVAPDKGVNIMQKRRGITTLKNLSNGPGKCTQALGINLSHNQTDVTTPPIWVEDGLNVDESTITASKRIGIDYAEEDAEKLWRFNLPTYILSI